MQDIYIVKLKQNITSRALRARASDGERECAGKCPIKAERPTFCRPFRCPQTYLQFLQFLASEAFLEAFACLPDCALPLSLAAEDCLPFALDLVFSMFTPFGGSPRVQTFACRG